MEAESSGQSPAGPRLADLSLCWVLKQFGHYHHARLSAFAARNRGRTLAVQCTNEGAFKEFVFRPDGKQAYELHTVLPGVAADCVFGPALRDALRRKLDELRPGVVCLPGWSNLAAAVSLQWSLESGTPTVLFSESTAYDEPRAGWREAIKSRLVRLASAALTGGKPHVEYAAALGLPRERIFIGCDVVDNRHFAAGADAARSDAAALRTKHRLPERYLLASGRFVPKKNFPGLLDAYARYRKAGAPGDWKLVILGDGPLRPTLEALCVKLGVAQDVLLPGFKSYDELPAFYGLASAFVHASTTEQWGLVVNEAMAAGLPVIVSARCGCAPDLVREGENGFTFDPADTSALAAHMLRLARRECDLEAMGRASRRIIARWTPDTFSAGLVAAAGAALAAPRRRAGLADRALLGWLIRWRLRG